MRAQTSPDFQECKGSQSSTSRRPLEAAALRENGSLLARAGLSSARMPMQLRMRQGRTPSCLLRLASRVKAVMTGPRLWSLVHHLALGEGNMPLSSMCSSRSPYGRDTATNSRP
jgi:hypothetical protein